MSTLKKSLIIGGVALAILASWFVYRKIKASKTPTTNVVANTL